MSIECCHPDSSGKFTDATYSSLVRLCAWLENQLDLNERSLLRHYDVTGKLCPLYFVEHEGEWNAFKEDVAEKRKDVS